MDTNEWLFRVVGRAEDVATVVELFSDSVPLVELGGLPYVSLALPKAFAVPEGRKRAEVVIAQLNAAAQIAYGNHNNVAVGAILRRSSPDTPPEQLIEAAPLVSGFRAGGARVLTNRLLVAAMSDELFDRALYLFGALPRDWRGLYVIFEVAVQAQTRTVGLEAKNWVQAGAIKRFKETANSFRALGGLARHGTTTSGVDRPTQTLEEAEQMIRNILERWGSEIAMSG